MVLLFAQPAPPTLDQVRAEPNLERRAKLGVDYAALAERAAESAYSKGDLAGVSAELKNMVEGVEIARDALRQTGKSALRHPGPYKSAELKTEEILVRLNDLEKRMDGDERSQVEGPRTKVSDIHDEWFDGIMSKKK